MTEFTIEREISGSKGRYVIRQAGAEAELTYSITSPTLVIADHTGVPDSFRGTGAGLALVTRLVADARAQAAAAPADQRDAAEKMVNDYIAIRGATAR